MYHQPWQDLNRLFGRSLKLSLRPQYMLDILPMVLYPAHNSLTVVEVFILVLIFNFHVYNLLPRPSCREPLCSLITSLLTELMGFALFIF